MALERAEVAPLHCQVRHLEDALRKNPIAQALLSRGAELALPNWYLGAGAVAQTVWNLLHGFHPTSGIKDYDLVYFDPSDLSAEAEKRINEEVTAHLSFINAKIDVKNEARVHLWYPERYGRDIEPYQSTEDAIATWPTTAGSVGVRQETERFVVCAPFGLADLFGMTVRPNKAIITRDIYEEKANRWAALWPRLQVISW